MAKFTMVKDGHLGGYIRGGDPGTWCPHLWSWAIKEFGVRSVMDVGCGEGHSAKFFHNRGCQVVGVEGCHQAIEDTVIPGLVFQHDFRDGPFAPDQPVDLVWSCEFLEHVQERYVPNILKTFAHARRALLITHAFPGQDDGHHHVNCRPSSYWIRQIEAAGFRCDERLSRRARTVTLRDYHSVNHFARSGLVFVRQTEWAHRIGVVREAGGRASVIARFCERLGAEYRAFTIHNGFRWSAPFREQRRRSRAAKRGRKRRGGS